tara:strand:+ start:17 stop:238 length:222 start_codon:yes stop_codon:yes gene_type:complete
MKTLELNQMEKVNGGQTNKDCFVRGLATTLAIGAGFIIPVFWGAAAGIIGTSGNCFSAAVSTPNFISGAAELL